VAFLFNINSRVYLSTTNRRPPVQQSPTSHGNFLWLVFYTKERKKFYVGTSGTGSLPDGPISRPRKSTRMVIEKIYLLNPCIFFGRTKSAKEHVNRKLKQ